MRKPLHLFLFLCVAAILAGCSDPRAARATRIRLDRIDAELSRARDRENDGPRRLAVMGDRIEKDRQLHDAHLARDLKRVKTEFERDRHRWQERQPRYRADITDSLDGDLQKADDTIPRMFY